MKYYTYILQSCKSGIYYVGSTNSLGRRLENHNSGKSTYTRKGIPWVLVYAKEFGTRSEAYRFERQIKSQKKRAYIEKLIKTDGAPK